MTYLDAVNVRPRTASKEEPNGKSTSPQIIGSDRFDHAIVVQFDDGICALFPATLLRSLIPRLAPSAIQAETE